VPPFCCWGVSFFSGHTSPADNCPFAHFVHKRFLHGRLGAFLKNRKSDSVLTSRAEELVSSLEEGVGKIAGAAGGPGPRRRLLRPASWAAAARSGRIVAHSERPGRARLHRPVAVTGQRPANESDLVAERATIALA
jgi:hypothetical protein